MKKCSCARNSILIFLISYFIIASTRFQKFQLHLYTIHGKSKTAERKQNKDISFAKPEKSLWKKSVFHCCCESWFISSDAKRKCVQRCKTLEGAIGQSQRRHSVSEPKQLHNCQHIQNDRSGTRARESF